MEFVTISYDVKTKDNQVIINSSLGSHIVSQKPQELLDYLAFNVPNKMNRKWFWDIDQALAPILKVLGVKVCTELVKEPDHLARFKFNGNDIEILSYEKRTDPLREGEYSFFYHRGTSAGLQHYGQEYASYFYSAYQYHKDNCDEEVDDLNKIVNKVKEFTDACNIMHISPMKASSPASLYAANVLDKQNLDIPLNADVYQRFKVSGLKEEEATELIDWSEQIMHREYTTNLAIGNWKAGESWNYDQSSAYGAALADTYDYRKAIFKKCFNGEDTKWADDGIMKGTVTINDVKISPIVYTTKTGQQIYPTNCSWEDKLTLADVRWLYKYKVGSFKMDYGYFWKYENYQQPFKATMQRIFDCREQGGLVKVLAKRMGAQAWGKLIADPNTEKGNIYYSPLTAVQVKNACRLKTASFIYDNGLQNYVIAIATDAVRTTKRVTWREFNKGMGNWKEEQSEDTIVLSPSQIITTTKKPRCLYYQEVVDLINQKPNETLYKREKVYRTSLDEAILKENLEIVGEPITRTVSINIFEARTEQDYEFIDYPTCGKDLLGSKYFGQPKQVYVGL